MWLRFFDQFYQTDYGLSLAKKGELLPYINKVSTKILLFSFSKQNVRLLKLSQLSELSFKTVKLYLVRRLVS